MVYATNFNLCVYFNTNYTNFLEIMREVFSFLKAASGNEWHKSIRMVREIRCTKGALCNKYSLHSFVKIRVIRVEMIS